MAGTRRLTSKESSTAIALLHFMTEKNWYAPKDYLEVIVKVISLEL
jgi:hypothetical protein